MLSPDEKRCVHQILQARVKILADPEIRDELGISPVMIDTESDMAQDVLDAAPLGDYSEDGREHVYILGEWAGDVRHYAGKDPLVGCPSDVLSAMDDAALAAYLQEIVRGRATPRHVWGIPRSNAGSTADLKRRLMRK